MKKFAFCLLILVTLKQSWYQKIEICPWCGWDTCKTYYTTSGDIDGDGMSNALTRRPTLSSTWD